MNNAERISFKEKMGYGFGDFASSMFWKIFGMYLLFFYTKVFGISPAAAGTMFLITRIWDSVNDPMMGVIADRTNSRWGKYRPYILWGAVPFACVGILTFFTPDLSETGKLVYAYITYTLMMMVYTAVNVPYASLLGVMTPNIQDRNQLSSFRMFFAYVGSFVTFMIFQPLVDLFAGRAEGSADVSSEISTDPMAWTLAAGVIGTISAIFFFLCFKFTKERVKPIQEEGVSIRKDLKYLLTNAPWWILLVSGIAVLLFNSVRDGVSLFYFADYVQNSYKVPYLGWTLGTLYLIVGQIANVIGVMLIAPISNKCGKRRSYIGAMILATVFSIIFYWMTPENLAGIFILQVLISICAGSIFPLLWSMYADIVDYQEWKDGRRMSGLIFSSSSMSQKMGWALGGAVSGWLLMAFGYDQGAAVQTAQTHDGLKMMMSIIPAVGCVISIIALIFYPLSEKRMKSIIAELNVRRNQNER